MKNEHLSQWRRLDGNQVWPWLLALFAYLYIYSRIWFDKNPLLYPKQNRTLQLYSTNYTLACLVLVVASVVIVNRSRLRCIQLGKLITYALAIGLGFLYYLGSGSTSFIIAAIIGFGFQFYSQRMYLITTGICAFVFLVIHLFLFYIGVEPDPSTTPEAWIRGASGEVGFNRVAFGYGHPNQAFLYIIPVIVALFVMERSILRDCIACIIAVLSVIVYFETNTRSMLIFAVLLLLSGFIGDFMNSFIGQWVLRLIAPIMIITTFVFGSVLYKTPIGDLLDKILSGRLHYMNFYIQNGFSLVGPSDATRVAYLVNGYPFDNLFLFYLSVGGVIFFIFMVVWLFFFADYEIRIADTKVLTALFIIFIYCFAERVDYPGPSFFLPMMFMFILQPSQQDDEISSGGKLKGVTKAV